MKRLTKDDVLLDPILAGRVRRYHTWPVTHHQSIAEHSWNVSILYYQIFGKPRDSVYEYIMLHDMGEVKSGDPPYPLKKENPPLKEIYDRVESEHLNRMGFTLPVLTDWEALRVKFCDLLDCSLYGKIEERLGNKYTAPIGDQKNGLSALMRKMTDQDRALAQAFCLKYGVEIMWDSPVERRNAAQS